jgi:hypothetical protein
MLSFFSERISNLYANQSNFTFRDDATISRPVVSICKRVSRVPIRNDHFRSISKWKRVHFDDKQRSFSRWKLNFFRGLPHSRHRFTDRGMESSGKYIGKVCSYLRVSSMLRIFRVYACACAWNRSFLRRNQIYWIDCAFHVIDRVLIRW